MDNLVVVQLVASEMLVLKLNHPSVEGTRMNDWINASKSILIDFFGCNFTHHDEKKH